MGAGEPPLTGPGDGVAGPVGRVFGEGPGPVGGCDTCGAGGVATDVTGV